MDHYNQRFVDVRFWQGKSVLVTGHTGFKGSWLSLWLYTLGARVHGYALPPPTEPNLFRLLKPEEVYTRSVLADIRDPVQLHKAMSDAQPEIVFHLAAQPLVRESYNDPLLTFETNVVGTASVLKCAMDCESTRAIVVVTSDKCYENKEWAWGYRENDALGGHDPYSTSKACAELVVRSWQRSFSNHARAQERTSIASVRAGNVIGGGDWSVDRLVPDVLRAFENRTPVHIRHPDSVRPWQHVLEPLAGYLMLAQNLFLEGEPWEQAWNFGPDNGGHATVRELVSMLILSLQAHAGNEHVNPDELLMLSGSDSRGPHEASLLTLDCSKANQQLGWHPVWNLRDTTDDIAAWFSAYQQGADLHRHTLKTIESYSRQAIPGT